MDLELTGKVAVVTGASRGIGKAIAGELAKEGVDVALCARTREALEEAAGELEQETGRRILPVPTDTTNWESVRRMVETTVVTLGKVDILVNSAATPGGLVRGALADAREEDLLEDINTKVVGYFRCAKAVAPYMQRQGWGRIINIGGLSGRQSTVISGMRNAAIVHLTKTLSDQLGPSGITVNLIHPGTTRTERSDPMYAERARQEGVTVEVPGAGDIARGWGPPFYQTETAYFVSLHRNKKSIEIDLKTAAGKELFFRLVERFDVVLENYRVGTLDKLGIAYDQARRRNPGIIYCSVSGFGQTGPYRDRAALDLIVQAESGMISITGEPGSRGEANAGSVA